MGFWGSFVDKIKSGAKKLGNGIKKAASTVKKAVTTVWNKYSGKDKFNEAEALYEKISARYNTRRKRFEKDVEQYTNSIELHVQNINAAKEKIKTELFVQMATNLEKIKDISINESFTIEEYKAAVYSFDKVREKSELYKIDFKKHKIKTTLQALFIPFYTRKRAKETLYAVQEEEKKVDAEIAKMDAETVKLKAIDDSLANVDYYFTSLVEIYENLLVRLDNNVNYLYARCISFAHRLVQKEMSIRRLPLMQQKEVEAIITASKILKTMVEAQIVSLENSAKVEVYSNDMKQQYEAVNDVFKAA